jgi:hypothetical protein
VTDAFDDLHPGVLGEVALGVGDERDVDAAVAIPVEVKRRLRRGPEQRCMLDGVSLVDLVTSGSGDVWKAKRLSCSSPAKAVRSP